MRWARCLIGWLNMWLQCLHLHDLCSPFGPGFTGVISFQTSLGFLPHFARFFGLVWSSITSASSSEPSKVMASMIIVKVEG